MIHINSIRFLRFTQYANMIDSITENIGDNQMDFWINLKFDKEEIVCPHCKSFSIKKLKGHTECTITHVVDKNRPSYLHINQIRYKCPECSKSFTDPLPFVFPEFLTISKETILNILFDLKNTDHSFNEIAACYHLSDKTISRIFNEYVSFGPGIPTSYICIDEKCYQHGNTKFCLPILDFETNRLIDIKKDRLKRTLIDWLREIRTLYASSDTSNQITVDIKLFCIDMSQSYYDAIKLIFPNVPIAVDSFHVIKMVNDALNQIRINVMKSHYISNIEIDPTTGKKRDEETIDAFQPNEYRMLKIHWKLILSNKDFKSGIQDKPKYNKVLGRYTTIKDILDYLLSIDERLSYAWALKEQYMFFNENATIENADSWLSQIINDYLESGIPQFIKLAYTFENWKACIVNSFTIVNDRRISNGPIEGMNSKLEKIIINSNGITNFNTLRKRALLRYSKYSSFNFTKHQK